MNVIADKAELRLPERTATPGELERRFGVSAESWRRWVRLGRVAGFRVSPRRVVVDLADAERLVVESRVGTPAV